MNRRRFLAATGTAVAIGVAGCSATADCSELPSETAKTIYASREKLFLDINNSGLGGGDLSPSEVSDAHRNQIAAELSLTREMTPVSQADNLDPDGYGPYTGFYIHDDVDPDAAINAFESRGYSVEYDWWRFSRKGSWDPIVTAIQKRVENAKQFSATQDGTVSVPPIQLVDSGSGDRGQRARWDTTESLSSQKFTDAINAFNKPSGLAVTSPNGSEYVYANPETLVTTTDVKGGQSQTHRNFEVELELAPEQFDQYAQQVGNPDVVVVQTSPGIAMQASTDYDEVPVARTVVDWWTDAYAVATSVIGTVPNPLYTNGSVADCTE